jgi:hypothetical protein
LLAIGCDSDGPAGIAVVTATSNYLNRSSNALRALLVGPDELPEVLPGVLV